MTTLAERIASDSITITSTPGERPADGFDKANWYRVTLTRHGASLAVPFGMGYGHTAEPTAAQVLDCLLSDASGIDNAASFEEWADDYGENPDSRKTERLYRAATEQTDKVRAWLGDAYEAYVWETDRD